MNVNELLEQCEKDGIRLCLQSGQLQITGNLKKIDELAPIIRQHKTDIIRMLEQKDKRDMEATRYMQAEIALFHGEAIAFIARYLQKRYGKTYWQAQDEATTVWNILRKNQITGTFIPYRVVAAFLASAFQKAFVGTVRQSHGKDALV